MYMYRTICKSTYVCYHFIAKSLSLGIVKSSFTILRYISIHTRQSQHNNKTKVAVSQITEPNKRHHIQIWTSVRTFIDKCICTHIGVFCVRVSIKHKTIILYRHIHTFMLDYCNINTEMNASSDRYSHTYIHTYIHILIHSNKTIGAYLYLYIHIYKYIILYKCSWTRVVLTSVLISLSAPWLTRYSTTSLCPLAAALIIAVYPLWS